MEKSLAPARRSSAANQARNHVPSLQPSTIAARFVGVRYSGRTALMEQRDCGFVYYETLHNTNLRPRGLLRDFDVFRRFFGPRPVRRRTDGGPSGIALPGERTSNLRRRAEIVGLLQFFHGSLDRTLKQLNERRAKTIAQEVQRVEVPVER
jgi:hypothetical protein